MKIPMWVPWWIYYTEYVRVGRRRHIAHYWFGVRFIDPESKEL